MVFKSKKVRRALKKKGFEAREGKKHIVLTYCHEEESRIYSVLTVMSRSHTDIDDNLISTMADQCRLSNKDFKDLVNCPLDRKGYEKKLEEYFTK